MTNVNKGHSRMDTVKDGFNKGLEYLGSGSKALALATALAVTGVHANEPTFVIDGQVYTAQQIEKNSALANNLTQSDINRYVEWKMGIINDIEADTARRQANIDRMNANIDRMNARTALGKNLTVMADIIMGNSTNDYTFRQVAKAFDEVASDYSLNISDKSRQVYKTISQAYAQGNTLVHVSDEIKLAFLDFINAVRPQINAMPAKDRDFLLSYIGTLEQALKL